jgi:hypothetical protein
VVNVAEPEEIAAALERLFADPAYRARVGAEARDWVVANHGPPLVQRTLDLCTAVVAERAPR